MDYFNNHRRLSSAATNMTPDQSHLPAAAPPSRRPRMAGGPSYESLRAPSTIRIRRAPPSGLVNQLSRPTTQAGGPRTPDLDTAVSGRRRSSSAPQRPFGYGDQNAAQPADLSRQRTYESAHMPALTEGQQVTPHGGAMHPGFADGAEGSRPVTPGIYYRDGAAGRPNSQRMAAGAPDSAQRQRGGLRRFRSNTTTSGRHDRPAADEYSAEVIDLLDLIDPEVRTIGTLTNLQNSLFIPDLGSLVNRRPTYELTRSATGASADVLAAERSIRSRAGTRASRLAPASHLDPIQQGQPSETEDIELQDSRRRTFSISSQLSDSRYAVLPHGVNLEGWTDEDVAELNDHVRHLLHSRKEGFRRNWRGFRQYVRRPLGLFVVVYATLVTLFGAAWVFCLIGWIYIGNKQSYFINVIDNVLVSLFALMGDGLAPFRAVDTYHMCFIAHYHHLTWRLRNEKQLPQLTDHNDLPDRRNSAPDVDDIIDKEENAEFSVLSPRQQRRLQYHQAKFNKSHTFYKPHETSTHHAFPLKLLVAVVVLLDCHSLLQVALGTCTWSIDYRVRPQALTATILSCSITCNIMAGVLISVGDHKTRKKDVLEKIFRQGLTEEAMKIMARKHERGALGLVVDPREVKSEDIRDAAAKRSKSLGGEAVGGNGVVQAPSEAGGAKV